MASITIRKMEDELKVRLRIRAAMRGRSMEDEARDILRTALAAADHTPKDLATALRRRFGPLGGIDLEIPPREPMREPPQFSR
jgi:antitoxin FitA